MGEPPPGVSRRPHCSGVVRPPLLAPRPPQGRARPLPRMRVGELPSALVRCVGVLRQNEVQLSDVTTELYTEVRDCASRAMKMTKIKFRIIAKLPMRELKVESMVCGYCGLVDVVLDVSRLQCGVPVRRADGRNVLLSFYF